MRKLFLLIVPFLAGLLIELYVPLQPPSQQLQIIRTLSRLLILLVIVWFLHEITNSPRVSFFLRDSLTRSLDWIVQHRRLLLRLIIVFSIAVFLMGIGYCISLIRIVEPTPTSIVFITPTFTPTTVSSTPTPELTLITPSTTPTHTQTATYTKTPVPTDTPTYTPAPTSTPCRETTISSSGGSYGWQVLGKWALVNYDAYRGCGGAGCAFFSFKPETTTYQSWWTHGYNDSAWSNQGYVAWNNDWDIYGWEPIPSVGNFVWKADNNWFHAVTHLHRRAFEASSCEIASAKLTMFSDNRSEWYLNGNFVHMHDSNEYATVFVELNFLVRGQNLLAVAAYNDTHDCGSTNCNPVGLQYVLELEYR